MRKRIWATAVVLCIPAALAASQSERRSCPEVAPQWFITDATLPEVVVCGEVTDVKVEHLNIGWTDVVTLVTMNVGSILRGAVGDQPLTFWIPLACVKGEERTLAEPPLPAFGVGDQFLVLLEADRSGGLYCRGHAFELSDDLARTPTDIAERSPGIPLRCYESWIDSLTIARSPGQLFLGSDAAAVVTIRSIVTRGERGYEEEVAACSVERSLKGPAAGSTITVIIPVSTQPLIADVPVLREGDTALLFLDHREDGAFGVAGGREGVRIVDAETGLCRRPPRRHAVPALPAGGRGRPTVFRDDVQLGGLILKTTGSAQPDGR